MNYYKIHGFKKSKKSKVENQKEREDTKEKQKDDHRNLEENVIKILVRKNK